MTSIPSILHGNLLPYLSQLHKTLDHSQVTEVLKKIIEIRDGCKAKEILSNHGKMHKALYGRIKIELQLNIMEIGPSGLPFGL